MLRRVEHETSFLPIHNTTKFLPQRPKFYNTQALFVFDFDEEIEEQLKELNFALEVLHTFCAYKHFD